MVTYIKVDAYIVQPKVKTMNSNPQSSRFVEAPPPDENRFPSRKFRSAIRHAVRLWVSLHRLTAILDVMAAKQPASGTRSPNQPGWPATTSPHWPKPVNQAAFNEWVQATYKQVFNCERRLDEPILPVDVPSVRGLTIYAARCGNIRFFGAWTQRSGVFCGVDENPASHRRYRIRLRRRRSLRTTGVHGDHKLRPADIKGEVWDKAIRIGGWLGNTGSKRPRRRGQVLIGLEERCLGFGSC